MELCQKEDDPIGAEMELWALLEDWGVGVAAEVVVINRTAGSLGNWPAGVQLCA